MDNFRSTLEDCGLKDLGFCGPKFTWSNRREPQALIQERLDRFVANSSWYFLFPTFSVRHLEYWKSDHQPIIL